MITLLVPTMNRSDFLIRLLRYYEDVGFEGCICIGDSSNPDHVERIKRVIETLQGKFTIIYKEYPGLNVTECLVRMLDLVSTPYAALCCDDDFLIPNALNKCAKFLDDHPDYAFAHGKGIWLMLDAIGPYGRIAGCDPYQQAVLEAESASQRLDDFLCNNCYAVLFSVHRIETWQAMFRHAHVSKDNMFGGEILPGCISVVLGKSKELDCLHLVRQNHAQRVTYHMDFYDIITSPEWNSHYLVFRDRLVESLARQDSIITEDAMKVVKHGYGMCLAMAIKPQVDSISRWFQVARKIPGARRMWRFLHSYSGFSLSALLRSSSPYHSDFMPVYKALTTPPTESSSATDKNNIYGEK